MRKPMEFKKDRIEDSMKPAHHLNQPSALEKAFHRDMLQIYQRAKEECGYNATRSFRWSQTMAVSERRRSCLIRLTPQMALWNFGKTAVWISPWKIWF